MAKSRLSSRERLLEAATELFLSQGFAITTTRQIADLAQVNEATLFRNFGSKHDLLLSVINHAGIFAQQDDGRVHLQDGADSLESMIHAYVSDRLQVLGEHAELVRALVAEAGQYSVEQQRALSDGLIDATRELTTILDQLIDDEAMLSVPSTTLAELLNALLYGSVVLKLMRERQPDWEALIDALLAVCVKRAIAPQSDHSESAVTQASAATLRGTTMASPSEQPIADLPATTVRSIFQQAKKQNPQAYAIVYLLFGAGLLPGEVLDLERSQHVVNPRHQLIQINQGLVRQVPINQWIMGKRYGSYTNNPLTQWLKHRKDEESRLFLADDSQPLSLSALIDIWQTVTEGIVTPGDRPPQIEQARQTWCVEMLMRGLSAEDLSLLSGWTTIQLQPYVRRAREKIALDRALQVDQKLT
jgi:AcrR family transcriptional regulator